MSDAKSTTTHKNEVHISGLIAKEPSIRSTTTGKTVATVTVATTFQTAGSKKVEYHRIVFWEDLAVKVKGLPKGEFIKVVGRLQTRSWEDNSKVRHYATEVIAFQLVVPSQLPEPIRPTYPATPQTKMTGKDIASAVLRPVTPPDPITNEDIPF